jgi:3D (Asp-Asp-Asp) domain-containing protein
MPERKGGIAITKEKIFLKRWMAVLLLVMVTGLVMHHRQTARPVTYTVIGENTVWVHTTAAGTPGQVLEELGLTGNFYAEDLQIFIQQEQSGRTKEQISRIEQYTAISPVEELRYGDPTLPVGETRILRPGQSQQLLCTARVTYTDGVETVRKLESQQLLRHGEARIVAVGTGQWVEKTEKSTLPVIGDGIIHLPTGEVLTYSEEIRSLATAYCDKGLTATGTQARVGAIAVDPDYIPYGTRMFIMTVDGEYIYGIATAEDTGSREYIHDTRIDLHLDTYSECRKFGARWCRVFFLS